MAAHSRLWCSLTATYSGSWANCGKEQKILSLNACQIKTNKHFCTIYSFWKTTFRLQWWEDIQQLHFDYLSVFKYMLLLGQRRLLLILILNSSSTATKVGGYLSKCYWCCCFFFHRSRSMQQQALSEWGSLYSKQKRLVYLQVCFRIFWRQLWNRYMWDDCELAVILMCVNFFTWCISGPLWANWRIVFNTER